MALKVRAPRPLGIGTIDHLGIDAGAHGVDHVAAGQVDGRGPVEVQVDVGPMGGDDRLDHVGHAAAGQIVGLQPPGADARVRLLADARLHRHDLSLHDGPHVHPAKAHADQAQQADIGVGHVRPKPDAPIIQHDRRHDDGQRDQHEYGY